MHQTFDTRFQFNKRAVVGNARDLAIQSGSGRKPFLDRFPGVRQKLFVTQRHALARSIKSQHLDLDRITNPEEFGRILEPSPRHVSHVQQSINAAQIDERAVVRQILDLSLDDYVFLNLFKRLSLAALIALFQNGLARQHHV